MCGPIDGLGVDQLFEIVVLRIVLRIRLVSDWSGFVVMKVEVSEKNVVACLHVVVVKETIKFIMECRGGQFVLLASRGSIDTIEEGSVA